jgi:hypothetical protein
MNYQEKYKWLSEFYRKAAETGCEMEYRDAKDGWIHASSSGPSVFSDPKDWRLKPEHPKAWVVWDDDECRMITSIKGDAEQYANRINGTIQEITRPD